MTRFGWHRLAAVLFVVRIAVILPLVAGPGGIEPLHIAYVGGIHLLIAAGYLQRHRVSILFGIYAAVLGLVYPFLVPALLADPVWVALNTAFSLVLLGVALTVWRSGRAAGASTLSPRERTHR